MSSRPTIKILVSCHKQVCHPESDLFVPVHVGAEGKTALEGMQPDNQGKNISDRNFSFCEMSGQYWAWKNLDADYIGQCHYRRYFCFDGLEHEANDHGQIEDDCLSPFTIEKYHIADEEAIRSSLNGHDMIIAPYWSVKGVPTLCGPKKNIRDHMVSYGLVTDSDLDMLISICEELRPEFKDELVSYLRGDKYLGYNCFIMKKQLFDRLCEFEFSILQCFDARFDYSNKTVTHRRICGYLGEILYSVFVSHACKEGASIAKRPLVFFDHTPKLSSCSIDNKSINIIWRYMEANPAMLAVSVTGLCHTLSADKDYCLTIIHNSNFNVSEFKRLVNTEHANLKIEFITFPALDLRHLEQALTEHEAFILLPFLASESLTCNLKAKPGKILYLEGCALFLSDPANIVACSKENLMCAKDILLEKEINKPFNRELRKAYLSASREWGTHSASALVVDAKWLQEHLHDIIRLYHDICSSLGDNPAALLETCLNKYQIAKAQPGMGRCSFEPPIEVLVVRSLLLQRLGAQHLSFDFAFTVDGDNEVSAWANEETIGAWQSARPNGLLLYAPHATPFNDPSNAYCQKYWLIARQTPAYESLLITLTEPSPTGLKDFLFPIGTRRRKLMASIYRLVHKVM